MIRRLHDWLFAPRVDTRVAIYLGCALFLGWCAVVNWNNGSRWLAAFNAIVCALEVAAVVVRIAYLRRSS